MSIEEHTEACPECDGSGEVECFDCIGSGMDDEGGACVMCMGDGMVDCSNCSQ